MNLLNFVCQKDGSQMVLFVAENGPECINDNKKSLLNCINKVADDYVANESPPGVLPQFIMGAKQCRLVFEYR